jgi:adenosine deaminase
MKARSIIIPVLLSVLVGSCQLKTSTSNENEELTAKFFDLIKKEKDNAQLTLFFSQMPKGGDIHHHYSGAIYAETYLDWLASRQMTINSQTYQIDIVGKLKAHFITIDSLRNNAALLRAVLDCWSDMDFSNFCHLQDQPDQHFFSTFSYFGTVSAMDYRAGLLSLKYRAKKENVQYIETMISSPSFKINYPSGILESLLYFQKIKDTDQLNVLLDSLARGITSDPYYNVCIKGFKDSLYSYHKDIDDSDFSMRFQTYASRNSRPEDVFTKLYCCFDAVSRDKSSLLVGVNIVGPENGVVAMRDYWLHMQMFKYLKNKFPKVKTSMHAGELSMGMVRPEDLTYHISDAVFVANADRIGHGIDLPYETRSVELLKRMRDNHVAVEINLTSNEFILGVKNEDHPINIYFKAGVPIVISTDDAGVSRNNLTVEFVKLASRYNFDYKQLKKFVYNSIQYSFMDEAKKQELIKILDNKFVDFESKIASQYSTILK